MSFNFAFPAIGQTNQYMFFPPPPPPILPFDRDISPPRKRTRTTPEQLAVLEKSFSENPSPNNRVREQLSIQLGISERSIQIWFQNRRAKVKNQAKKNSQNHDALYLQQQYAASAAAAACQSAAQDQNLTSIDPNLYYYYYYYYFQQQQQQQQQQQRETSAPLTSNPAWSHSMPDLTLSASTSSSSIASRHTRTERTRAHSVGPYHRKSTPQERHTSAGPPSNTLYNPRLHSTILEEISSLDKFSNTYLVNALQIGTWKRVSDVQCQVNFSSLVWCISDEQQHFRIVIDLHLIQYIRFTQNSIEFFINDPTQIKFFMTVQGQFVQCHDFTQDKQATTEHTHVFHGEHMELKEMLMQTPDLQSLIIQQQQQQQQQPDMLLLQSLRLPQQ